MGKWEALRMQCETINAFARTIYATEIELGVRAYLTELIERARIVAKPDAPGRFRRLSLASTRQLYRDVQFLLEPPALSW